MVENEDYNYKIKMGGIFNNSETALSLSDLALE